MIFTKTDKALLDRAARIVHDQARIEETTHGPVWAATAEGKEAKKRFDRLLRDERDLRQLARRLESTAPTVEFPASTMGPATVPPNAGPNPVTGSGAAGEG
jgi:hypothetical protein